MKRATLLAVLLAPALAFGQKFDVSDLSASGSPISFTGTTKILKTGTACVVTAHNDSSQSLLAMRATADVATRYEWDQPVTFRYDGFFKESGIPPGLDFDVVDEEASSVVDRSDVNGSPVEQPSPNFACHAKVKVLFIQFEDGSTWGDNETKKDFTARRARNMAAFTHLVEAYDSGGQTAFDATMSAPGLEELAFRMKYEAEYYKTTMVELARRRLAAGRTRQASGNF